MSNLAGSHSHQSSVRMVGGLAVTLAILLLVVGVFNWGLKPVEIRSDAAFQDILSRLGMLCALAVFVERTVEVYASVFREGRKQEIVEAVRLLDAEIVANERANLAKAASAKAAADAMANPGDAALATIATASLALSRAADADVKAATAAKITYVPAVPVSANPRDDLVTHSVGTQTTSILMAGGIGLLLGLSGISVLDSIVNASTGMNAWLRATDILLIAGLVAGGSQPLHQIIDTVTDLFKATREGLAKK